MVVVMPSMERPFHVIAVAGAPASGKGTVCDGIEKRYGLVHISTGQILRDNVQKGTELGCLLDNFPLTEEQAESMKGHISVDMFILLDVPDDVLIERAVGRYLDPHTGRIYHEKFRSPPAEIANRLVQRGDDKPGLVEERLRAYKEQAGLITSFFEDAVCKIDGTKGPDEVMQDVSECLDTLEWSTLEKPYFGNVAFNGPFSHESAHRAGFFSPLNPPELGDSVVCFRRGADWDKRGSVVDVSEEISTGNGGLKCDMEGIRVVVDGQCGTFISWSAFLAPINDMEYSSICTTHAFLSSNFCRLYAEDVGDVQPISKTEARESLQDWLGQLEDADEEPVEMAPALKEEIFAEFDNHADASLFLYSSHKKLGPRTSLAMGQDYSVYYRALNNTLNSDAEGNLSHAMVLIKRMIYSLLYDEDTGAKRLHKGGRVWKGDGQRPVPLNMHKLREANRLNKIVRFRQFQSTTTDEALADKYRKREDGKGFKWIIDIPPDFWGARDIKDVAWKANESETLFPPYSAFRVESIDEDTCHLLAVDRSAELKSRAERHGLASDEFQVGA
eukprot:TRINITY_DN22637_c0_g1_i1.p1 TRINITY_DN22637_c0_g1~~TRINITY_DN22637_c0_g1_i1.p1  ORF type:complete len:581 (-),score=93.68 TRINITY_DN22637_c0_g1_i1:34-1710(-)